MAKCYIYVVKHIISTIFRFKMSYYTLWPVFSPDDIYKILQ